jgi:hypothetical protein
MFAMLSKTFVKFVWPIVLTTLLAASLAGWREARLGAEPIPPRHKTIRTSGPAPLPDQINALARQLYGIPYYNAGAIPGKIQELVFGALTQWLNQKSAWDPHAAYGLDVRVRMQLENDLSKLHYPWYGQPAVFVQTWQGRELIGAGYTLGWTRYDSVNAFALYLHQAGNTTKVSQTDFVPQTDLRYAFLAPGAHGSFRFLIYGSMHGASQPSLSVILYSFDGKTLQNLWEQRNLYDGKIAVTPQTVTLRYLKEPEYVQAVEQNQLPPGYEEIYQVTAKGLGLETERQISFQAVNGAE